MNNNEAHAFLVEQIQAQAKRNKVRIDDLAGEFDLFQSGVYDSLSFVGLINQVEKQFNIEIDFSNIEPEMFTTLAGLGEIVNQHLPLDSSRGSNPG